MYNKFQFIRHSTSLISWFPQDTPAAIQELSPALSAPLLSLGHVGQAANPGDFCPSFRSREKMPRGLSWLGIWGALVIQSLRTCRARAWSSCALTEPCGATHSRVTRVAAPCVTLCHPHRAPSPNSSLPGMKDSCSSSCQRQGGEEKPPSSKCGVCAWRKHSPAPREQNTPSPGQGWQGSHGCQGKGGFGFSSLAHLPLNPSQLPH